MRRDIDVDERLLDTIRRLQNAIAHDNPIVHTMSDTPTLDERRRGAPQLAAEYSFLQDCLDGARDQRLE